MVTKPLGIAILWMVNDQDNSRILVVDSRNSRLLIVKLVTPSIIPWPASISFTPSDVATYWSTRDVFVTDIMNDRILKFTHSNALPTLWPCSVLAGSGSEKGHFNKPVALAIDNSSGDLYVSDRGNNRIQKLNGNGEFVLELNNFWATGMAVDLDKNVYVSVAALHKVFKFTPDLTLIPQWDPVGTSNVSFRYPHGITIDHKNDVYVVDSGNFEVKKFTKDGAHLLSWGGSGRGNGKFRVPYGIAYDLNAQTIFVSDSSLHRIQVFNENGSYVKQQIL